MLLRDAILILDTKASSSPAIARCGFGHEEWVPERLACCDPLVGVQSQTLLQQIDKVIEMPCFCLIHPRRCRVEAGSKVACWLYDSHCSHGRLEVHVLVSLRRLQNKHAKHGRQRGNI